jgi:hypothetical protein
MGLVICGGCAVLPTLLMSLFLKNKISWQHIQVFLLNAFSVNILVKK